MKTMIDVTLADITVPCALKYPEAAKYFPSPKPDTQRLNGNPVSLTEEDWAYYLSMDLEDCAYTEYSLLTAVFSDALMDVERVIVHASAIRYKDRAYLLCGKSGVGKSTQTNALRQLCPGEFGIICGDRPVLSFTDGRIKVWPSPWNGKENWHDAEAAPLAGVVVITRGEKNQLYTLNEQEASVYFYPHMIHTARDAAVIHKAARYTSKMLYSVPAWKLVSNKVPESTKQMLEAVF